MSDPSALVTQVQQDQDDVNLGTLPQHSGGTLIDQPGGRRKSCCWHIFGSCLGGGREPRDTQTNETRRANETQSPARIANNSAAGLTNSLGGSGVQPTPGLITYPYPNGCRYLLPPLEAGSEGKKTLVLDLDETLVHSSFKPIPDADFVIAIELEGATHQVFVRKRPGVDYFMTEVGKRFEVVIFTASLAKYADPLLDILDRDRVVSCRLFREACVPHYGNYVKDLTHLGRPLSSSIIIDNSPFSYMFQPDNAIPVTSWFTDKEDRQLYALIDFFDYLTKADNVIDVLRDKRKFLQEQPPVFD